MKNKTPLISVITCTLNASKFLEDNLESVNKQNFKDIEHVFVDGYSTDGTVSLINDYQKRMRFPVKLVQQSPQGISAAMNEGVRQAKGTYLIHLNADDYLHNHKVLEEVVRLTSKHPEEDWFYGQIQTIEKDGTPIGIFPKHWVFQQAWFWLLKYVNYIPHQAVIIKRIVFSKYGLFDVQIKHLMDYDLWLRIAPKTSWRFINLVVSNYRVHEGGSTSSKENLKGIIASQFQTLDKNLSKAESSLAKLVYLVLLRFNRMIR